MISYRDMSQKEIDEYRKKSIEEFHKKYDGVIDPETLRWTKQGMAASAVFAGDEPAVVNISATGSSDNK